MSYFKRDPLETFFRRIGSELLSYVVLAGLVYAIYRGLELLAYMSQ